MPAFGKSGTCRMCCLRSIGCASALNGEGTIAADFLIVDVDFFHARAARSVPDRPLNVRDRFGVTLYQRLDAAVRQVPHPPHGPLAAGGVLGEPAEAHTLNASADDELA